MRSIRHRTSRHRLSVWVLCLTLGASSVVPGVTLAAERSAGGEFGLGALSVLCTLVYGTVKITYAGLGALTGGFAYVLSGGNADISRTLLERSLRGDYVVTPEVLTGQDSLVFIGRDPVNEPSPSDVPDASQEPAQSEPYPY
jgi:hypothetical protein